MEVKNFKSQYTEYGKEKEKEARDLFVIATGCRVLETGLIVSKQNPWLAYSPDGIIFDDNKPLALLEIKCPFKGKNMTVWVAIKHEFSRCLDFSGENLSVKKKHKYYGQLQLGMAVINVQVSYFFIYCAHDRSYLIIKVNIDVEFILTMLSALKRVYFSKFLHEICSSVNNKENDINNNI